MTSPERLYALYKAVEYLTLAKIPGAIVACGVWRGGSMMCAAMTLLRAGNAGRLLYLYDTFKRNMAATRYPADRVITVQGDMAQTIPARMPGAIALLRPDTDWYASTRHELHHLFPRLVKGGVLIIDDYGHWKGARLAPDDYFAVSDVKIRLNRIDDTGRIGIR